MPRVVNLALAAFFLAFLIPLFVYLGDVQQTAAQVFLVLVAAPFVLLTVLCLCSAIRPGSLGRAARKLKARRAARPDPTGD